MTPADTSLAKRLASYSAAAGVTLALVPAGSAQIVYNDIDPDASYDTDVTFELDVDGDGTVDFVFGAGTGGANTQGRVVMSATNATQNAVLGQDAAYFTNSAIGSAFNLDEGTEIGGADDLFFPVGVLASIYQNTPYYNFTGEDGIVGFRFVAGAGTTHFGWARISGASDALSGTISEYAFESTPDTPIIAGATGVASDPDALESGYLFSEVSPNPVAGRSTFQLSVGQAETVTAELYDTIGRRVQTLFTGALTPGTTQTVAVTASELPAGVYVVRVTGDSFVTTRNVTVVR